jgi:hypothetical protein
MDRGGTRKFSLVPIAMLHALAVLSLAVAVLCAIAIAWDVFVRGNRQQMGVMDIVWPVTALYSGPLGLWAYFRIGRLSTHRAMMAAKARGETPPGKAKPFAQKVGIGTTHCGAGCSLGDLCAETLMYFFPFTLFGRGIFAGWAVDFAFAFAIGIAFQYFSIKPMRQLSPKQALVQALKADSLSLTAWQVGMYGWMAIATFLIFGTELGKTDPVFWFMMQAAMLAGFVTSYPVNWWLIRKGIKESM